MTLWTVACEAPLSLGFSRQEYWSGLPCPPPRYLPNQGIEPVIPYVSCLLHWHVGSLPLAPPEKPNANNLLGCCLSVTQSCLTLCNPMDCSSPDSSVREIFQARILEWVAISFSRASFQPRDQTRASTAGRFLTD